LTNQKQELPKATMFVNGSDEMSNLYAPKLIMISVCMNYEHLILITYQNTLTHRYNSKGHTYSEKIEGAIINGQILKNLLL
jgi:hypothetical protein